jgi:hypothetical protein
MEVNGESVCICLYSGYVLFMVREILSLDFGLVFVNLGSDVGSGV